MNRNGVITVKDREGNLTDCILTAITNRLLIDNGAENDNSGALINLNECKRRSKMDETVGGGNEGENAFLAVEPMTPNAPTRSKRTASTQSTSFTLDDVDLINVVDLCSDSEDCWLYKPSQKHNSAINPLNWVQDGFSGLKVQNSNPTLLQMLCAIYPRKGAHPKNSRILTRPSRSAGVNRVTDSVQTSVNSSKSSSHQQKDDQKPLNRTYDKKDLKELFAKMKQNDDSTGHQPNGPESKAVRTSNGERQYKEKQMIEGDVKGSRHLENCVQNTGHQKVVDVNDVQMLAKMQEDSLRKSFCSSSGRSLKSELNKSTGHLLDGCGQGSPLHRSTHSSPGRTYDLKEFVKSRNSLTSASSESCSPHESLLDVNSPLSKTSLGINNAQQRSLPNLLKSNSGRLAPEEPLERSSTPSDESIDTACVQQPLPPRRSMLKQPSKRTVTTLTKSEPDPPSVSYKERPANTPKDHTPAPKVASSIPRPSSISKIRQPSKIAVTRRGVLTTPIQTDSSWREGCF